jgi:hypothetical protein
MRIGSTSNTQTRWEGSITLGVAWDDVNRIDLAQDRQKLQDIVNIGMNFGFCKNSGNFVTGCGRIHLY